MQFKCAGLSTILILLLSCASQNDRFAQCDHDAIFTRGLKDGELGLNHLDHVQKICSKAQFNSSDEHYLSGRNRGLKNFCNSNRAQNRVLLNLELEEVCKDVDEYVVWFEKGLDEHCTKALAIQDSQSLRPSNNNCLKVEDYEKTFKTELSSLCTKKWAYQQGHHKLTLNPYCLETKQKDSLILSHKLGLNSRIQLENKHLEEKMDRLSAKMKALKKVQPSTREEKENIELKKDKISRELLETLHTLEQSRSNL